MKSIFLSIAWIAASLFSMSSCEQENGKRGGKAHASPSSDVSEPFVIAPRLVRNDGSYELLAVIEGVEPNRLFVSNIQIVTAQRAQLKKLKDQSEADGDHSEEIETLEKKLRENAEYMVKTYGYSISANYLFIPVESSLMKVVGDKKELIREFDSPSDYQKLQDMRTKYTELLRKNGEGSTEASKLAGKLAENYGFNVKKKHILEVQKGVLYRKLE
jgi:hypothetical protein